MLSCFELLTPAAQGLETSPVSLLLPKAQIEDGRHRWGCQVWAPGSGCITLDVFQGEGGSCVLLSVAHEKGSR